MTSKLFQNKLLTLALAAGLAQALAADIVADFNTAGGLTTRFSGYSDFAEQATGGLGDSGAVALTANSQVAVYQTPVNLAAGTDHVLSMYFQYNGGDGDGGTGRGFFVGFTSGAGDTYETSATTTGVDIRGIVAGSGSGNLYGIDLQNDGANVAGSAKDIPLVIGNWYYLELAIAEALPGEFQGVQVALYASDASGNIGGLLKVLDSSGTGGYAVASTLASSSEAYAFFGGQNPASRAASTADNFAYTQTVSKPVAEIARGTPSAIDGAVDESWSAALLNRLSVDIDGTSPAADDLSGYWKAMWDDQNLYFLIVTEDDLVVAWPGSQFWNYDMTELFLDMDYSRNSDVVRYDANDFQLFFPRDGQAARNNGPAPVSFPLNYSQVTAGNTTVIELVLPWSELLVTPEVGHRIGVDVYMKDNDTGAPPRESQISWSPSADQAWKNPSLFGTGILVGPDHASGFIELVRAKLYADGRYISPWYGSFTQRGGWTIHAVLGWLYTGYATAADAMFLYSEGLGSWVWTSEDAYPGFYAFSGTSWVYYLVVEGLGTITYDYSTGSWTLPD